MTEYANQYAEYAHTPCLVQKDCKIWKTNAKSVYLTLCLPAAGRPGVKVKNMHNNTKYVEYAEYGLAL
jgi:hypothetical protein